MDITEKAYKNDVFGNCFFSSSVDIEKNEVLDEAINFWAKIDVLGNAAADYKNCTASKNNGDFWNYEKEEQWQ